MSSPVLAVDFGTSNSAAAVLEGGVQRIISLEAGSPTLPSALFLDFEAREMLLGQSAIAALVDGREGRFMRALKSVLGAPLFHEKRQYLNERTTLGEIVTRFLVQIRRRAELATGHKFDAVLAGRPVRFHHRDDVRDAQALTDLEDCYWAAGFAQVTFMPEPEAAALASAGTADGTGLVVDIGGGTSDFSVFRRRGDVFEILASHGIRLGGTDFDRTLSLDYVMPLLGKGTNLRAELGSAQSPTPNAIYHDLSTWARIPFLYSPQVRRDVARMAKLAVEPRKLERLAKVLEQELGHDIAFAVERGKISVNARQTGSEIGLDMLEPGLRVPLTNGALSASLRENTDQINEAAQTCVALAGMDHGDIDRVVLVGGSSLMTELSEEVARTFPRAGVERGNAFTAIIDGLALATPRA